MLHVHCDERRLDVRGGLMLPFVDFHVLAAPPLYGFGHTRCRLNYCRHIDHSSFHRQRAKKFIAYRVLANALVFFEVRMYS